MDRTPFEKSGVHSFFVFLLEVDDKTLVSRAGALGQESRIREYVNGEPGPRRTESERRRNGTSEGDDVQQDRYAFHLKKGNASPE